MRNKRIATLLLVGTLMIATCGASTACRGKDNKKHVLFGAYEQDNNLDNGKEKIEWIVLAQDGDKDLLISKNILDWQPFNKSESDVTWETCTLRKWLNETFLNEAFSSGEQNNVIGAEVTPDKKSEPEYTTLDKVFVLSLSEAKKYIGGSKCDTTAYCLERSGGNDAAGWVAGYWFLRTPGDSLSQITYASSDGIVTSSNKTFQSTPSVEVSSCLGVRPVIWVNHDAVTEVTTEQTAASEPAFETISFGTYEQDNKEGNGKENIEWFVLAREGDKALIVSKYVLATKEFGDSEFPGDTWDTTYLRTWLNDEFLNEAFSQEEQSKILSTTVTADKNPRYDLNPGNDTTDKVFLLSIDEAKKYFSSDGMRQSQETASADRSSQKGGNNAVWWLRSTGINSQSTAYVNVGGEIIYSGHPKETWMHGVRPAMWVRI